MFGIQLLKSSFTKWVKIQRRAARFVCNDYQQKTSASGLIRSLNWDMLSTRRKIARVCVLHKALGGHLAIPVSDCLRPVTRSTRLSNPNSFIPISTRTDCYKYSFFPRTALDWNSLPSSIQEIKDSNNFKTQAIFISNKKIQEIKSKTKHKNYALTPSSVDSTWEC